MLTRQPYFKVVAALPLPIEDMKNGIIFDTEQQGTDSVLAWAESALCPLNKARYRKPGVNARGKPVKGRRDFGCSHGRKSSSKAEQKRPWQRVKFTGCQVKNTLPFLWLQKGGTLGIIL